MKMMKKFTAALISILSVSVFFQLKAEDVSPYIIEVMPGKKVLTVANLDVPPTTTLSELLTMFPELLARETDERLVNYDIQVNDVSVASGREAVLSNLFAQDIKKIELSLTPDMSEQQKGQGGTIKVILRDVEEGFSGSVTLPVSSMFDVMPCVALTYQKKGFFVRGSLIMEYYKPYDNVENQFKSNGIYEIYQKDTIDNRYGSEVANVLMEYKNDRHELKAWAWESYSKNSIYTERTFSTGIIEPVGKTEKYLAKMSIRAGANYKFKPQWGEIQAKVEYDHQPQREYTMDIVSEAGANSVKKSSVISGFVKGMYKFVRPKEGSDKCNVWLGVNYDYTPGTSRYEMLGSLTGPAVVGSGKSFYLAPFSEIDAAFGPVFLKGGIRYQMYNSNIVADAHPSFHRFQDYFTSFLNFGVQVAPHHHLSLICDRSIKMPAEADLYPYMIYSPLDELYYCGNQNLNAVSVHDASLQYIFDVNWESGRKLVVNTSLGYVNDNHIITPYTTGDIVSYKNDGRSDIATANVMLLYNSGPFSVSFTGNAFSQWSTINAVQDHYTYYNLSISPMLNFSDNWMMSARFVYNSKIFTKTSRLSDYFYSQVKVAKKVKNWLIFGEISDNFHCYAMDEILSSPMTHLKYYNLHRPALTVGFNFVF